MGNLKGTEISIRHAILTAILILVASAARAEQPPITFARSGKAVSVQLAMNKGQPAESIVLRVYGRVWTKPAAVKASAARVDVPAVRVPTVFQITAAKDAKRTLGELVAYPDRPVNWGKETRLYALGTPKWFDQWAKATGLPVIPTTIEKLRGMHWERMRISWRPVLIVGRDGAGKTVEDLSAAARAARMPVVVLEADWLGDVDKSKGGVIVHPKQMRAGLANIAKQKWPKPLRFSSCLEPWPGLCNRRSWVAGEDGPLVEEIRFHEGSRAIVLNYLPWQQQLGRREAAADMTLRMILKGRVAGEALWPTMRIVEMLWPRRRDINAKDRPVISAAVHARAGIKGTSGRARILDLRGGKSPSSAFLKELNGGHLPTPLLILGDDRLLDDWKWLGINRNKKTFKRQGIAWLPDDALPPSAENQIRLMLKLTELGIRLEQMKREKEDEKPNK